MRSLPLLLAILVPALFALLGHSANTARVFVQRGALQIDAGASASAVAALSTSGKVI